MQGRIEKLAGVTFSGQAVRLGGVGSLGNNVRATEERRLWVDWARGVVVLCVLVPNTSDRPARWAVRYFPVAGGDVAHMDPGDSPTPLDFSEEEALELGQALTSGTLASLAEPGRGVNLPAHLVPGLRAGMTAAELARRIPPDSLRILAREGFVGYGDEPGPAGPWKTFDGRPMPTWGELLAPDNATGTLTVKRWEAGALAMLEAALGLGLLEGVGFRPAGPTPAELVHYSKAANDARTGYRAVRLDQLTPDEHARVRRCADGALWLPFPVAYAQGFIDKWEVPPLEHTGQLAPGPGEGEQDEAERLAAEQDAKPATVEEIVEALADAGYQAHPARVAAWTLPERAAAYSFAVNEASGDETPIPEHVRGLPAVMPGPGSRAPDRTGTLLFVDPAKVKPDELVHVAAIPSVGGALEVPAVDVRVGDLSAEQRSQLVRQPDGSLLYTPPAASPEGQQRAAAVSEQARAESQQAPTSPTPASTRGPKRPK